jgi:Na+-driven multidrug efflux pump
LVQPQVPQRPALSYRHLLSFYIPLALSSSMMTLEPLVINTALSHAPNSETTLAAYSVMFSIALVIEAPVIMLVSASNALSKTQDSFRKLFRFMLILAMSVVVIGFVVSLTPLYGWLVLDLMGIPPAVAQAVRPGLVIMSIWPFPIAWRRTLQGLLIAHNRTPVVTAATLVRLLGLIGALVVGRHGMGDRMLVVSALAMQVAVIAESLVVTPPAFRIVREMPSGPAEKPLTWGGLFRFYQPLAMMMILRQIGRPMLSAGIAAAQLPERSLAAWSVAWSLIMLPFGVTMGLEQVAIAKGTTPPSLARVRRFAWGVGLVLSGALVLLAFVPAATSALGGLFELTPEIQPLVILVLRITAMLPLLQSLQALLRGVAIGEERTPDVRSAVAVALLATALVTVVGPRVSFCTGAMIGAGATMLSAAAEVGWLAWRGLRADGASRPYGD